jgi:tRNA pseudouridine38-40 synthase
MRSQPSWNGDPRPGVHTDPGGGGRTARWLVRFGYDGAGFAGWARQPGERTIEGEIRQGLVRFGVARTASAVDLEVASRTDRGVSARANALALRSDLPGTTLLRMLNGISPAIRFTAAAPIPETFRVRAATRRVYRYFDAVPVRSEARRSSAARAFRGSIDVRSFGRGLPAGAPVLRTVESVTFETVPGGSEIEVRAPSFVWGMVRKIVAALREVDAGRLTLARLRSALAGYERLSLPMAEPEPLVLWEVEHDVRWAVAWAGPSAHQARAAVDERATLWARARVLDALPGPIA